MRCDWNDEQIKSLQRRLKVWPSGNLEHETWAALVDVLEIPTQTPGPPKDNVIVPEGLYSIKGNCLYKGGERVSQKQSPNHGGVIDPEIIVIHYTGSNNFQGSLSWLTSPGSKVSAHLIITKEGVVWQLLPLNVCGWHAGVSSYDGRTGVNSFSIGIENQGLGDEWPEAQIQANIDVIKAICQAYQITGIVGHCDVAPGRKVDPGAGYPWDRVREATGF